MSVPNWLSVSREVLCPVLCQNRALADFSTFAQILTGAEPESHGVLGNLIIPETKLDTVFNKAQQFGLHRYRYTTARR